MLGYLTKRLLLALVTLFLIVFTSYLLLRLAPGNPARGSLFDGGGGATQSSDRSGLARNRGLEEELHLNEPVLTGFAYWFGELVTHGSFGRSAVVEPGRPVGAVIAPRLWVTLKLNLLAVLITWMIALPAGVWSAARADGIFDQTGTIMMFFLYSLPAMWVALMLQSLLCEGGWLNWFPLRGLAVNNPENFTSWQLAWENMRRYVLPVTCLAYAGIAMLTRYVRGGMLETLHRDYIRTARAKGVPESEVIWKHAFRNALITLITLSAGLLPGLVAGSVMVEYVFGIPGMGALALLSLSSRDYPLQMAIFVITGVLTLGGILLADLLYTWADPRISLHNKK